MGARFRARVLGGAVISLRVIEDGVTVETVPIADDDFVHEFHGVGNGRWRVQVMNDRLIETVSSPIWIEPGYGPWSWVDRRAAAAAAGSHRGEARVRRSGRRRRDARLNGLFGPPIRAFSSGVASPQPVSAGIVVVPVT